jgi:hypothetical protein
MTDEHLMRQWVDAHSDFSTDLDRGLLRLGRFFGKRFRRRQAIGNAYAAGTCAAARAEPEMNATARAALAGVLACIATTALLVSVAALAGAGAGEPVKLHTAMAVSSPVVAHVILA